MEVPDQRPGRADPREVSSHDSNCAPLVLLCGQPLPSTLSHRWPVDPKAKVPEEPPKRWRRPTLQYGGVVLDDESLITSYGFLNNEILYLDFAAPWDPPPEKPGAAGGGGKKKKV